MSRQTRKKRAKAAAEPTGSGVDSAPVRMNPAFEDEDCFRNILSFCDAKSLFRVASVSTRLHRIVLNAIQLKITGTLKTLIGGPNTAWLDRLTLEKFEMEHAVIRLKTSRLRRLYYRATRAEAIWSIEGGHELRVSTSGGIADMFAHNGTRWQFSGYYDSSGAWDEEAHDVAYSGMTEDEYYIDKYQKSGADAIERSRSYGWRSSADSHMDIEIILTVDGRKKKSFRCDASATEGIDLGDMATMYDDSCDSGRQRKEFLKAIRTALGANASGTENKVEYFAAWACSLACADPLFFTLPRIAGESGSERTDFHRAVRQMYYDAEGMARFLRHDVYVPFPSHHESYRPDRFLGDPDDRTKFIDIEDPPEDDDSWHESD